MEHPKEFLLSLGVEFLPDGRGRWSKEAKAYIVAETLRPGATVNGVAHRFHVGASHVSDWCRRRMANLSFQPRIMTNMLSLRLWFFVMPRALFNRPSTGERSNRSRHAGQLRQSESGGRLSKVRHSDWFMTLTMTANRNSFDPSALPAEFREVAKVLLARGAKVDDLEQKVTALETLTAGQNAQIPDQATALWPNATAIRSEGTG